jgi:hypothetical protein
MDLLTGFDIDEAMRWRRGKAEGLARKGKLPHYTLPDGSIRFRLEEVKALIKYHPLAIPAGGAS